MWWRYLLIGLGALIALNFVGGKIAPRYLSIGGLLGQKAEDHGYYYRFKSAYMHKDERVEFDIVVGCSVRVTTYGDNSSSWDALRYPSNFVKATKDGGAVWQPVDDACRGESTGKEIPLDYIPGAIFFKDKNDLSFGIGYFLEDAFEGEDADLKFLGASIIPATRAEWEAFQPVAQTNLIDPKPFTWVKQPPKPEEVAPNMWNKQKWTRDWSPGFFGCYGVHRQPITDPVAKAKLAAFWPKDQPRFWKPTDEDGKTSKDVINKIMRQTDTDTKTGLRYVGVSMMDMGTPTKAGGGLWYGHKGVPADVFPYISSDDVPRFGPELLDTTKPIYRDVATRGGKNLGRTYCYIPMLTWFETKFLPGYRTQDFIARIDGETIYQGDRPAPAIIMPEFFFERTDYYYFTFTTSFH